MSIHSLYHSDIPAFLLPYLQTPELVRLRDVGMNCGVEYSSFEPYCRMKGMSRYDHSLGTALIAWHFSQSVPATLAALFHDISTPVFAHAIDFMNGDYTEQESTEALTASTIVSSEPIMYLLQQQHINPSLVSDDRRYPLINNKAPRLCADRLEYTLHNCLRYGVASIDAIQAWYEDLYYDRQELVFRTPKQTVSFAKAALIMSRYYVADCDRYCMEAIARMMRYALSLRILSSADLYRDETTVISILLSHPDTAKFWHRYTELATIHRSDIPLEGYWQLPAKKRYIDPLCQGKRASQWDEEFATDCQAFLETSFACYIKADPRSS